jgi:hypothetical protein
MTESEWLRSTEPQPMLEFLQDKASERKLRLFAVACVRGFFWWQLSDLTRKRAVEVAEIVADDNGTTDELGSAYAAAVIYYRDANIAGCAARDTASPRAWDAGTDVLFCMREAVRRGELAPATIAYGVHIIRCIFGNPFRLDSIDPAWLTPSVVSLATAAYQERTMPSGDLSAMHLAILADALEETGCTDADILSHLRDPGVHVRGCWPLDLVIGLS